MAKFTVELDQSKVDIVELKSKDQITFLIINVEKPKEDNILNLMNRPPKAMGKGHGIK